MPCTAQTSSWGEQHMQGHCPGSVLWKSCLLYYTFLVLRRLCATSLWPPAKCLWRRQESSRERKGVFGPQMPGVGCLYPALQQRAIAHSEFSNAAIFSPSLITVTTSLLGRYLPLPKAIAQRFFPLQNLGLKADTAMLPPSQIKMISH